MPSHARAACVGAYMRNVCAPARQSSHLTGGLFLAPFAPRFTPFKTHALFYMIVVTDNGTVTHLIHGDMACLQGAMGLPANAPMFLCLLYRFFFKQHPAIYADIYIKPQIV